MIADPSFCTLATSGIDSRNAALPKFIPVPLLIVPANGRSSARSREPQVNLGWERVPEPLIVPRLNSRLVMSRLSVPFTSMLSWFRVRPDTWVYG